MKLSLNTLFLDGCCQIIQLYSRDGANNSTVIHVENDSQHF